MGCGPDNIGDRLGKSAVGLPTEVAWLVITLTFIKYELLITIHSSEVFIWQLEELWWMFFLPGSR